MVFEINKFYRHSGGGVMHMIALAENPIMWFGPTLIAEENDGSLRPCGTDETSAVNWHEITEEEFKEPLTPNLQENNGGI